MPPVADTLPAARSLDGGGPQQQLPHLLAADRAAQPTACALHSLLLRCSPGPTDSRQQLLAKQHALLLVQQVYEAYAARAAAPLPPPCAQRSGSTAQQRHQQQADQDLVLEDSQPCGSWQQQQQQQKEDADDAHGTAATLPQPPGRPLHNLLGGAASSSLHEQDVTTTTSAHEQPGSTAAAAAAPPPHTLTYHQALDRLLGPSHRAAAASTPPGQQQLGAPAYLGRQRRLPAAAAAALAGGQPRQQQQHDVDQLQGGFDADSPGGVLQQQQRRLLQLGAAGLVDAQSQAPGAAACVQADAPGSSGSGSGGSTMPPPPVARGAAAAAQQLFSPRTATHEPLTAGGAASGGRPRRRSSTGGTRLQHARSGVAGLACAAAAWQQAHPAAPLPESADEIEVTPSQRPGPLPRAGVAAGAAAVHQHHHQPDGTAAATRQPVPQPWGSGLPGTAATGHNHWQQQQLVEPSPAMVAATPAAAAPFLLRHAADLATALFHTPGCQQQHDTPLPGAGATASGQRRGSASSSIAATPGPEQEAAAAAAAAADASGPVAAALVPADGTTPQQHSLQPRALEAAAASLLPATLDETLPPSQDACAPAVPAEDQQQQALPAASSSLAATPPPHAHAANNSSQPPLPPDWQQQQQSGLDGGGAAASQIPATPLSVEQQQQLADTLGGGLHGWPASGGGGSGGARATPAAAGGGGARCLLGSFVAESPVMPGVPPAEGVRQQLQQTPPGVAAAAAAAGGLLLPPPSPLVAAKAAAAAAAPERHASSSAEQPQPSRVFRLDQQQRRVQHVQLGLPVVALHCCAGTAMAVLKCPQDGSRHFLLHLDMTQQQQHAHASVSLAGAAALHHTAPLSGTAGTHLLQSAMLLLPPLVQAQQQQQQQQQDAWGASTARGPPLLAVASEFRCQALDCIPGSSGAGGGGGGGPVPAPDTAPTPAVNQRLGCRAGGSGKRTLPRMASTSPSAAAAHAAGSASHGVSIYRLACASDGSTGHTGPATAPGAGAAGAACQLVQQLPAPRAVQSLAVCSEAGLLAAGCEGGCVCLWPLLAAGPADRPSAVVASADRMQELPRAYYRTLVFDEIAHLCFMAQPGGTDGSSPGPQQQQQHAQHLRPEDSTRSSTAGRVLLVGCCKLGSTAVWDALAGTLLFTVHTPGLQLAGLSALRGLPSTALAAMLHDAWQAPAGDGQQQPQPSERDCPAVLLLARVLDRSRAEQQQAQQQQAELRPVLVQSCGLQCGVPLVADAAASRVAGCMPGAVTAAALCGSTAVAATAAGASAQAWDVATGRVCLRLRQGAAAGSAASGGVQAVGLVPLGGGLMVVLLGSNTGRLSLALL